MTIASAAEDAFVFALVPASTQAWLGAFQPAGSPEPDGNWQWVTGEAFTYTNWDIGQPDNDPSFGPQNVVHFLGNGRWDDYANTPIVTHAFIVEYNMAVSSVAFTPSTLTFGTQPIGTTSSALTTTLTNTMAITLTINSISLTGPDRGDFLESTTCGSRLAPDATCTISASFHPTASVTRTALVSIVDDAPDSPHQLPLAGIGILAQQRVYLPVVVIPPPIPYVVFVVPGGAGVQTGADWANGQDLQAALRQARPGAQLWVKAGTYTPTSGVGSPGTELEFAL